MNRYLPIAALMMAASSSFAAEPLDAAPGEVAPQIQMEQREVILPSLKLGEKAEMITQQKTDDAVQRMNDAINRDMDQQLSERYAASD